MFLSYLSFLISYDFWSRLGFLLSYSITFLLILEVVRLASTDANKREVERMLDAYTASRSETPRRHPSPHTRKIPIEELEKVQRPQTPERGSTRSPAATPELERVEGVEQRRRRTTSVSQQHATSATPRHQQQKDSSPRRLRKRSDTVNSSGSTESQPRGSVRRRREASPASLVGLSLSSKSASRQPSPTPKSKEGKLGSGLQKMLRTRG